MYKGSAISKLAFRRSVRTVISRVSLALAFSAVIASPFFARILF